MTDCIDRNDKKFGVQVQLLLALGLVLLAVAGRWLPHPPNATPVAAVALLAGALMTRRGWALAVPLAALLLSDALLGFYSWGVMLAVYAGLALPAVMGRWVPRGAGRYPMVAGLSFTGAVAFFIVSNLGVFLFTVHYAKTQAGLLACFAAALPFFKYTLLGDVCWALGLFAVADLVTCTLRRPAAVAWPRPLAG